MRDIRNRLTGIAATALLGLALGANAAWGAETYTMKFGTPTINDGQFHWMQLFKQRVEKATGGRMKITLYPSSQLGEIRRQIEALQLGTQEGVVVPPSFFVGVDPRYQVIDAPGLFTSSRQLVATLSDPKFREPFLDLGEAKGVRGIGLFYLAATSVVTKKPIRTLADFRGRKIRVFASPMQIIPFQRLGAAGVPMPLGEVMPALQRGVIDGVFGSFAIYLPFKYYNTARYITETNWSYVVSEAYVSKIWFDRLPHDIQTIILDQGKQIDQMVDKWSGDFIANAKKAWTKNGGELIELSQAERDKMMKQLSDIGDQVAKKNPAIKDMYALLVKTAESHR